MDLKSNTGANDSVPLLEPQPESQQPNNNRFCSTFGFFLTIFFLLTNFFLHQNMSRNNSNPWDSTLVNSCYAELMLLLLCLRKHQNLMADSPTEERDRLKVVVWVLCSLLTCTFTWRISQILSWHMNIIIWGMSASLLVVGFYCFFLFRSEDAQLANKYCKLDTDHEEEKKFCELSAEDKV